MGTARFPVAWHDNLSLADKAQVRSSDILLYAGEKLHVPGHRTERGITAVESSLTYSLVSEIDHWSQTCDMAKAQTNGAIISEVFEAFMDILQGDPYAVDQGWEVSIGEAAIVPFSEGTEPPPPVPMVGAIVVSIVDDNRGFLVRESEGSDGSTVHSPLSLLCYLH